MPDSCKYCNSGESCQNEPSVSSDNTLGPSIEDVILCLLFAYAHKLCEKLGIVHKPSVKGIPCEKKDNDMNSWLSNEIKELSVQLSMLGYDLNEPGLCPTQSMLQARKFVLNRLAEIMEKKDELEGSICYGSGYTLASLCS